MERRKFHQRVGRKYVHRDARRRDKKAAVVTANTALYYGLRDKEWGVQDPIVCRATDWNMVDNDRLLLHDKIWDYVPTDPWTGLPIPDAVTDRTIATGRDVDPERCIAHYFAPHVPYRSSALTENRPPTAVERDPWEALRQGTDEATVWNRYLDEIRSVLDQVERLLSNYDADRVVITADHGELFGETGLYSHPSGIPHPNLRRVPWVQTEASDRGSSCSRIDRDRSEETPDVRDQLYLLCASLLLAVVSVLQTTFPVGSDTATYYMRSAVHLYNGEPYTHVYRGRCFR